MNQTIRQLYARRSVRAFEEREIPAQVKRAILDSATQAPTAGNQQLYTIIDVTDASLKETLAETCDHQPFIAKAPLALLFCADARRWYEAYKLAGCTPRKPRAGDFLLAVCDALIAAQNAVVAAESLSLGSCYIGDVMERFETHRALLRLPRYVFPTAMLVFGYPTQQQRERTKPPRFPLASVVHENAYREADEAHTREMFAYKTGGAPFDEWMQRFCARKYDSAFAREMSRSVEACLAEFMDAD